MRPLPHDPAPREASPPALADLPERLTVRARDLPPSSLDWLEERLPDPARILLSSSYRELAILALVPGALLFWRSVAEAASPGTWDGAHQLRLGALLFLAALALLLGGLHFHAAVSARLPRMKLLHSTYYVEVDYGRVHFFPLVHLHDLRLARRSSKPGATRTDVILPFGRRRRRVGFSHMDGANRFVQEVLRRRHLALHPPAGGAPPGVHGIELVPSRFLTGGERPRRRWPLLVAVAALAAVAAFRVSRVEHEGRERSWTAAHAAPAIALAVRWTGARTAKPAPQALACTFAPEAQAHELTRSLQAAVDRTLGPDALRVVAEHELAAAVLELEVTARPAGWYRAPTERLPAVRAEGLDFTLVLRRPGATAQEARGHVPPPAALALAADWRSSPGPDAACDELRAMQLGALARRVASALDHGPTLREDAP